MTARISDQVDAGDVPAAAAGPGPGTSQDLADQVDAGNLHRIPILASRG